MAFGLGVLRLAPDSFWRMTPREISFALEGVYGQRRENISRIIMNNLMTDFPDQAKTMG